MYAGWFDQIKKSDVGMTAYLSGFSAIDHKIKRRTKISLDGTTHVGIIRIEMYGHSAIVFLFN